MDCFSFINFDLAYFSDLLERSYTSSGLYFLDLVVGYYHLIVCCSYPAQIPESLKMKNTLRKKWMELIIKEDLPVF